MLRPSFFRATLFISLGILLMANGFLLLQYGSSKSKKTPSLANSSHEKLQWIKLLQQQAGCLIQASNSMSAVNKKNTLSALCPASRLLPLLQQSRYYALLANVVYLRLATSGKQRCAKQLTLQIKWQGLHA